MQTLVVGIAGGTGSGKTTVTRGIADALPPGSTLVIQHDAYYRHRPELSPKQRDSINFDHPDALETELLVEHLRALREGRRVEVPVYDFKTHLRKKVPRSLAATSIVLVEGILILADAELRELLDIKVFVDTDADIRFLRRIQRDTRQRGRTLSAVCDQYLRTVRPMHEEFVAPSQRWADLTILEGGRNQVAMDLLVGHLTYFLTRSTREPK